MERERERWREGKIYIERGREKDRSRVKPDGI